MAVFLDAVAGSLTANSYATIAEANAYHASELYGSPWADLDDDQKALSLITATRLLDENIVWTGWPSAYRQPLGYPRSGILNRNQAQIPNGTIPQVLKNATAMLALILTQAGELPNSGSPNPTGLSRMKVGPVEMDFNTALAMQTVDAIPVRVFAMIDFLIESRISARRTSVRLYRM